MPATAFPGKIKHFSLCCHLLQVEDLQNHRNGGKQNEKI